MAWRRRLVLSCLFCSQLRKSRSVQELWMIASDITFFRFRVQLSVKTMYLGGVLDCYCMHVTSTGSRLVVLVVHISMHFFFVFHTFRNPKVVFTLLELCLVGVLSFVVVVGVLVFFETIHLIFTTILAFIFTIFHNTFPDSYYKISCSYYKILLQH